MRKIIIEVEVSSRESLKVLTDDLKSEISCCWNYFDIDTMKVSEITDNKGVNHEKRTRRSAAY